jgi:hypothetical protein
MTGEKGTERPYEGDLAEEALSRARHFFAHTSFGHRVDSVEIGENFGRCKLAAQDLNQRSIFIIALHAGRAAVDRWYGWQTRRDEAWLASDDHAKAYKVALQLSNGSHTAAGHLMSWAQRMAADYINKHFAELHEPARLLAERRTLKVVR